MPGPQAFTPQQLDEMSQALSATNERSGLRFSVYVGSADGEDPDGFAARLLAGLGADAPRSVVLHVDPELRRVEIVTGGEAAVRLADTACGLAAQSMAQLFGDGELVDGVITGLRMLGDAVFWQSAAAPAH